MLPLPREERREENGRECKLSRFGGGEQETALATDLKGDHKASQGLSETLWPFGSFTEKSAIQSPLYDFAGLPMRLAESSVTSVHRTLYTVVHSTLYTCELEFHSTFNASKSVACIEVAKMQL